MREKDKKCPECNATVKETFNFCPKCGSKIETVCHRCWVKKQDSYSCGETNCPGYDLFKTEKIKVSKDLEQIHTQSQ